MRVASNFNDQWCSTSFCVLTGPPENESKSTGLEEERSSRLFRARWREQDLILRSEK